MPTMTEDVETRCFMPVAKPNGETLKIAMQELFLTGRILPVGAHLLVIHRFRSAEPKILEVVYSFMLPRDAALRRFEARGDGFAVHSELKPVREAAEDYERGLADGHLAALARQYRDGMVNFSLGNLRPEEEVTITMEILSGVELRDDGLRFRFPFTLAPSYHPQARAGAMSPGIGEIELPSDMFEDFILPKFRESAEGLHQVSFDLALESPWDIQEIASPSHSIRVTKPGRVSLAPASDLPDRDLVLDIRARRDGAAILAGEAGDGRRHFAAVVPSAEFGARSESPRTVVLLLDRSGSMSGAPIKQACKATAACLAVLRAEDRFGLVAFDDRCELFRNELCAATPENRQAALKFLNQIDARGGTEIAAGVQAAAALLKGSGGDIFILTDGQVFGTEDILRTARGSGCRLHSLGIGSASQDRFLALLARETQGLSRFVTPRERVDQSALDLFASVSRPVATELQISKNSLPGGSIPLDPPSIVYAESPLLLFGECDKQGAGSITLSFKTAEGPESREVTIGTENNASRETIRLLEGARLITDVEARLAGIGQGETQRENQRWEDYLSSLSNKYSLASRAMALVAVVAREGDRPGAPPKTQVVPVGLPQDMRFEGVFPSTAMTLSLSARQLPGPRMGSSRGLIPKLLERVRSVSLPSAPSMMSDFADGSFLEAKITAPSEEPSSEFDELLDLSIKLEADGGMPGKSVRDRTLCTLLTTLAFLTGGHDTQSGALREHVKRMLHYLEKTLPDGLSERELAIAARVVEAVKAGKAIKGDWLKLAREVTSGKKNSIDIAWAALCTLCGAKTP
jgi:Ca-activated chloride channel family protein